MGIESQNSKSDNFTEADYDFSGVTKQELTACYWYEYARESRAAIAEIESERKSRAESDNKPRTVNFSSRVRTQVHSLLLMYLSLTNGFPNTPWKKISDKDKKLILKMLAALPHIYRYQATATNPPLSFSFSEPDTMTLADWKKRRRENLPSILENEPTKEGFFAVNMKYSREVLTEEFTKWLNNFEGKPMFDLPMDEKKKPAPKPLGRKSTLDALNALGAMRLRYQCATFSQAKMKMSELKKGMNYSRRDSFNHACKSAVIHFNKLLGWLDSEKPIHFTDGWRRGQK